MCRSLESIPFIDILDVPVHCNVQWPTKQGAIDAPRGDICLEYLPAYGHVYNRAFDPRQMHYTEEYENSLHFSPRFQEYASALAKQLIETHDLRGKTVVEIGSGKGNFLKMLCEIGDNRGIGFDPSYDPSLEKSGNSRIEFVQKFFSEQDAPGRMDLICCRHVLEHIDRPLEFLSMIRRSVGNQLDTILYFEVPNLMFTLREMGIWDIIYEHCSYFSPYSLAALFSQGGFRVLDIRETFGGQFLTIEAVPDRSHDMTWDQNPADLAELEQLVDVFASKYRKKLDTWRIKLEAFSNTGKRVVVWGAGSKGVTFLNTLKAEVVKFIVDINPRKHGMFVVGMGQQIVAPEFLRAYRPDVVLVMNDNYQEEIRGQLNMLGLQVELMVT